VLSESAVAILSRKQVGGFAKHKCAKTHWSKRPSTVNCPNVPGMQCVCVRGSRRTHWLSHEQSLRREGRSGVAM